VIDLKCLAAEVSLFTATDSPHVNGHH